MKSYKHSKWRKIGYC